MNRACFNEKLKEKGIDENLVSFNDPTKDDSFCVQNYHGIWDVYYFERGKQFCRQTFQTESEALDYLLKIICNNS
ncbi:MAG: hypothetical protein J5885_02265 [Clostridia bacterium]|nr:hypothetical protein [Clostridia bacterium]